MQGFIATSRYYADFMSEYLRIPRERFDVVHPGLNLKGHGLIEKTASTAPLTIGYFARICPEKGLHHLVDAYIKLRALPETPAYRLRERLVP